MEYQTGAAHKRTFQRHARILALLLTARVLFAQYVGSQACRPCHPGEYEKQSSSPHARALAHAESGGSGEWAFGAGQKAITYVGHTRQDEYVERGLSFYSSIQALAPTPGHPGGEDLPYPGLAPGASVARCFRCHSTGTPRLVNDGEIQPQESGVRCESCHGPGEAHAKSGDPAAIGNPKRQNAVEINRFCGTCHRRPPEPGEVNDGRVAVGLKFDWSNRWNVRHQPAYLSQSACFRASAGALSCITCHDPHTAASRATASYDQRCNSCHKEVQHRTGTAGAACVTCHMPGVAATAEMQFTNHWIGVYDKGNPLVPVDATHTPPPLDLPPTAEGKLPPPNDVSTLRPLFEQSIAAEQKRPGSPNLARRFETLGLFLRESGNPKAAEQPLRQALRLNRERHSGDIPSSEIELAVLLQAMGKREEAVALFREAAGGTDARASALAYESLARLDSGNAAAFYAKAIAAEEAAWGKSSPRVATQLSNLALASGSTQNSETNEALLRRALEIQETAFGRNHYQTAATMSNLSTVLQRTGKFDESEELARQAFAIFQQKLPGSLELAAVCANLADLMSRRGDRTSAIAFLRLAIANDEAAGGADTVEAAADLVSLARLLQQSDDRTGAEPLLRRALAIYEAKLGPESIPATEIKRSLGVRMR